MGWKDYQELRRPSGLHGGEWRLNHGEPMVPREATMDVHRAINDDFASTQGIRLRVHDVDGVFIDAITIPRDAGPKRIDGLISQLLGGEPGIFTVDQCGRGYADDDWDVYPGPA